MAEFLPFRGVTYNSSIIGNLADVIAPPYDVISPLEQEAFYLRHPQNVIRLILGKTQPGDNGHKNVYTRSADYLNRWLTDGILIRDDQPGFYLTAVTFNTGDVPITRYGIIGVVRLEPFEKGIILPHERTFSKVKSEQFQLMKSCHANFNPVFSLYSDENGTFEYMRSVVQNVPAAVDLLDGDGLRQQLWPICDQMTTDFVTNSIQSQRVYIADGHHRYETALNFKNWVKENDPSYSPTHPANFVMMNLVSMKDPGLLILAAHRLLKEVSSEAQQRMLKQAADYFEIHSFPTEQGVDNALQQASELLNARSEAHAIGLYMKANRAIYVLVLKPGTMERLFLTEMPTSLLDIDVTVLTRLLMMELLGFDQQRLDDETKIAYRTTAEDAVEAVQNGEADVTFILNATKIDQVRRISEEGLIMPRKSTYFYPKLISGQVINILK
jgi:uncharacterized protein (DUF1015 family)